jgi:arsenite-transporting ATPase
MQFLSQPTRNLFFTGKGGVGKTSIACATAIALADQGKQVLLVSTDPASNLDEVLGQRLDHQPNAVASVPGLSAMNLDPEQAAAEYRERMVGPYRGVLPDAAVASMEEQFSGSCTLEIAAFDEFSKLLGDPATTAAFDHVIFDTAPTGHTLRLLTLPSAWSGFMENSTTGTSCLGPLAGLQAQQKLYAQTVKALGDGAITTLVLVTRPEESAFREAARTSGELATLGVHNQHLVINGRFRASGNGDELALAIQKRADTAIDSMPAELAELPRTTVPLASSAVLGTAALRLLATSALAGDAQRQDTAAAVDESGLPEIDPDDYPLRTLSDLVEGIAEAKHGVVLAMGKGGVGKTTVAAAVATALAQLGHRVHLSTTDPAAHLAAMLASDDLPGLTVDRIDPVIETANYAREVLSGAGAGLDEQGRALLEEDLRSPCTEEIAVFRAFAKAVAEGEDRFVVLDTAPTGHTILLLDSALAYHREVTRQSKQMPDAVEKLLPRLRDFHYTHVLIVTVPEATPVHEASQLQRDLKRAGIEPFAWVINQSLIPLAVTDPALVARRAQQWPYVREVVEKYSHRTAVIPYQADPPTDREGLSRLTVAVSP